MAVGSSAVGCPHARAGGEVGAKMGNQFNRGKGISAMRNGFCILATLMSAVLWCATSQGQQLTAPQKPAEGAPAGDKTVRDASKVTFDFKDTSLAEVVEKLAELSGNRAFHLDAGLKDKAVTLAVKDTTYWEAVDKIAATLDLIYVRDWGRGGLSLPRSPSGPCHLRKPTLGFPPLRTSLNRIRPELVTEAPFAAAREVFARSRFFRGRSRHNKRELRRTAYIIRRAMRP